MLQGGQASDFTNLNATTTYGLISLINATLSGSGYTPAQRKMIQFNMGNDNTTKQVGINMYQPITVLHIDVNGNGTV